MPIKYFSVATALTLVVFIFGCLHTENPSIDNLGRAMDRVAKGIEAYGSITMSTPLLTRADDEQFRFDLQRGASTYFDEAKREVQGGAAAFSQVFHAFSFGAAVQLDPTKMGAQGKPGTESAGKGALPAKPEGVAEKPEKPREVLSQEKFKEFQKLLGDLQPKATSRSALITAAGDNTVEAIFRFLGSPHKATAFKDKVCFFGVAMVSVNPGWRTQRDFAADLSVQVELCLKPARREVVEDVIQDSRIPKIIQEKVAVDHGMKDQPIQLTHKDLTQIPSWIRGPTIDVGPGSSSTWISRLPRKSSPAVAAVSPMTDIQTLDLMSSYRRRTQLAMALSFALRYKGLGAQAEAFDRYVKQREKDVFTRTAEVPVTAYSNGNMFGYQVGPVLRGIGDPTAKKPKPQYRLSRQAFPVLIICGLDREDLAPYLVTLQGGYASNSLRLQVVEPYLQFTQTPRWIPLTKKASKHRLSEKRILRWSHGLFQETLNARGASPLHLGSGTLKLARYRIKKLKNHAFGSYARQSLPVGLIKARTRCPAVPLVRRVLPGKVLISRSAKGKPQEKRVTLTLLGDHLNQVDPSKIISILGTTEVVGEGTFMGGALQVEVKIKDGEAPVVLSLELKRDAKEKHAPRILSLPVMVGYETVSSPPKPTVIRYTKKTGDEKVEHEVNISPGAGDTAIKSSESILKSGM